MTVEHARCGLSVKSLVKDIKVNDDVGVTLSGPDPPYDERMLSMVIRIYNGRTYIFSVSCS